MIKNILGSSLFLALILLVGCAKEDPGNPVDVQFEFDAVGSVSEQTVEEAKKTINGKWDVNASPSASKRNSSCNFYGVEFTEDRYALRFDIEGFDPNTGENLDESIYAYGPYTLVEGTDGNVTAVELFETIEGIDYKIATLTDIVVEENAGELNADFTVDFNLPDDIAEDFPCGNLSGDYSVDKDEPVVSEEAGSGNTNFAKLVNAWRLTSVEIDGEEEDIELFVAEDFADLDEEALCDEIYGAVLPDDPNIEVEALYEQLEIQAQEIYANAGVTIDLETVNETLDALWSTINDNSTEEEFLAVEAQAAVIYAQLEIVESLASEIEALTQGFVAEAEAIFAEYEANQPSEEEWEALGEQCGNAIETAARELAQSIEAEIEVTFSAFGTYIFAVSIDGETVAVDVNDWEFTNTDQTRMLVDGETNLIIDRITDTELRIIEEVNETDEESGDSDEYTVVWRFTRIN